MKLLYAYTIRLDDSNSITPTDISLYKEIYKFDADSWLVDRSGTINLPYNELLAPQYTLASYSTESSFENACIARATELLDQNQKIYVMWSGGIDSTAIIVALLAAGRDLSNVTIVLNQDSIREYPDFYYKFVRATFPVIVTEEFMAFMSTVGVDGIVLSGEHADQLHGSLAVNAIHQHLDPSILNEKFTYDSFKKLMTAKRLTPMAIDCWYDMYRQTFSKSPRPINTIYDFIWWHGFNFRWQAIGLKIFTRINSNVNFQTFYSGTGLQNWSIDHTPDLSKLETLKMEIKSFIRTFAKDDQYYQNKIKHPSCTLYYGKPSAVAVDQNMNKIPYAGFDHLAYHNTDNSIAKWLTN